MPKKFCPNCGHELKSDAAFCPNCGKKIVQDKNNLSSSKISEKNLIPKQRVGAKHQPSPNPKKTLSKKAKLWLISGGSVLILLIIFFAIGNSIYSKNKQVSQIMDTLTKTNDASGVIKAQNNAVKVTKANTQSTQEYFKNLANKKDAQEQLIQRNSYAQYKLVQDGRNLLFFPKYKLEVPTYNPTVTTNHANSQIYIDGKNVGKVSGSDGSYRHKIGPLLEGNYVIETKSKVHGKNLSTKLNYQVNSNSLIDMNIKTGSFKVKSEPNAEVYINGEKVGKLDKNGEKKFSDYPLTNKLSLYVQTKVNGKSIKSETIDVTDQISDDETVTLKPKFTGEISQSDAEDLLKGVLSTDEPDEDSFIGGDDNRAYSLIADALKKTEDLEGFENISDCNVKILNMKLSGKDETTVNFQVAYSFDFDDKINDQTIEWDGCVIKNTGSQDSPEYKIKDLGKSKMIKNRTTAKDDD